MDWTPEPALRDLKRGHRSAGSVRESDAALQFLEFGTFANEVVSWVYLHAQNAPRPGSFKIGPFERGKAVFDISEKRIDLTEILRSKTHSIEDLLPDRLHCCVSGHSGREALQLQRLESTGHFRVGPPSRMRLPIRSKWTLSALDGPTTIESKKPSANLEIANSSQNWTSRAQPFEAGFTEARLKLFPVTLPRTTVAS